MVKITLDHSGLIFFERHPELRKLLELNENDKIRVYHAINLEREIETLTESERKIYEKLRFVVFGDKDLTLREHGDICLLINHIKSKRDFFVTMEKGKYAGLEKHRDLKIRFPDKKFLSEVKKSIS